MAKTKAKIIKCCFCGHAISELESHNPDPLGKVGDRCCVNCNTEQVIPTRLRKEVESFATEIAIEGEKQRGRPPYTGLTTEHIDTKEDAQKLLSLINKYFPTTRIEGFSRHLSHKPITVRRWLHGERKIPNYAFLTFKYIQFLGDIGHKVKDGIPVTNSGKESHKLWN